MNRPLALSLAALLTLPALACKPKETAPPVDEAAQAAAKDAAAKDDARKAKNDEAAAKRAMLAALPPLPGVEAAKPVKFPDVDQSKLPNGLEVLILRDTETPVVEVNLVVKAGSIYAPADASLLADLTAQLLAEGTKKRSKAALDALIDATGGSASASNDSELATLSASMLSRDLDLALQILAEEATEPLFPEASFQKIKDLLVQGVASEKAAPFGLAMRMGRRLIFGESSPYGRPFASEAEITALTRDQVVAFHQRHYGPQSAILVIAGDVDPAKARALAAKHFGKWKAGEPVAPPRGERPAAPDKTVIHIIDRKASAQATIAVIVPAPGIGEPRWIEGKILQSLLGGGLSGRLNQVLREQLGLTYGVGAFNDYGYEGGMFFAGGSTKTKSAGEFTEALLELLREPGAAGVPEGELGRLKSKISGQFALQVEGVEVMVDKTITQRTYNLPGDFWERYRVAIEAVTADQLKQASAALWSAGPVQIIVVGRADKISKELAELGEVRTYDTDLRRTN
ncbi:MAG: insulinase family protein [Nannocystis sp.]|nr:insulinase family protein [Nannocystis sp.]